MDQGHIEQAASAQGVYTKPLTAYVARFMGGQNVFAGRVSEIMNGVVVLDMPQRGSIEFPASDPVPSIGSTAYVSVRRDRIHLTKQAATGTVNTVSGKVRAIEYQGTWVKVTLISSSTCLTQSSSRTPSIWATRCGPIGSRWTCIPSSVVPAAPTGLTRPDRTSGNAPPS
jgi:ABC-type Fe3+/spermidine/putrescine transport system ATPase subunit